MKSTIATSKIFIGSCWALLLIIILLNAGCNDHLAKGTYLADESTEALSINAHTKIWLQPGSELEVKTNKPERAELRLNGRAYVESSAKNKTDIIITSGSLRTVSKDGIYALNSATSKDKTALRVTKGEVAYQTKEGGSLNVYTNENLMLREGEFVSYEPSYNPNPYSWRTNRLVYKQTPLNAVAQDLLRHYDQEVMVFPDIANCPITASYDNVTLAEVINDLSNRLPLSAEEVQGRWLISGYSCQ